MPSYTPVRAVQRALELLSLLGARGGATVGDLHRASGIAKPTVVRLLETLIDSGYVTKDDSLHVYSVSEKLYRLGGFQHAPFLIQAAREHAPALSRQLKWPVSLAILDVDSMIIPYSTMVLSPISWTPSGHRLPLLTRAMGRAYFAFCSPEKRALLLRMLCDSSEAENAHARDPSKVAAIVEKVREQGFAERHQLYGPRNQTTLAVPLVVHDETVGSLGLTYYVSAIGPEDAIAQYIAPLQATAKAVEASLIRLQAT